ncbi:MAG: hypothetical protein EBQ92_13640 [Proteobacteria bacterium]|nr:hypothetical protein [Pseudomonadota bacterium]
MAEVGSLKLLFTIWVFLQALIAAPLAYSDQARHNHSSIIQKRPVEDPDRSTRPWWDFWGVREKVIDSYQDTITWEVDLVFGKKATDNLGHALLKFFFSPEGKKFVYQNKNSFLVNKLEDTDQFEKAFWEDFEAWLKKNEYQNFFDERLVKAVNLLPLQPKLHVTAYYPKTPIRKTITRGVDHIYYLLADDIARTMPGGGLAPGVIANALRRASRGGAILPAVQKSYYQYRNALTDRMVNLIGVLAKKLVRQGVEKSGLDMKVELDVVPWEKTAGFKANPTFPIRSYFYATNAKKAIVPYQVTEFLDSLDTYDFNEEVRQALK